MFVFIDTTAKVTIGLLDHNFSWLNYKCIDSNKSSEIIHNEVYVLLNKYKLKIKDISGLIYLSGPGSYTGMRISEGFAQVLKWQKVPTYSFYHFDVPNLLNLKDGKFISKAFKGETFIHDTKTNVKKLVNSNDVNLASEIVYSYESYDEAILTTKLIKENAKELFTNVIKSNQNNDVFYYRSLDDEFKR